MKRICIFCLLIFFLFFAAISLGEPISLWNYTVNISTGADLPFDVANDSFNNIIVVGYDYSPGIYEWRIMKLDKDKNSLWNYTYNSTGNSQPLSVAVDKDNNIIAVGLDTPVLGDSRWRIMKIAPDKTSIWNYTTNESSGSDVAQAVAVDNESNIIVAGYDSVEGNTRWRIMKLDKDKNSLWNYTPNPSTYPDQALGVAVDKYNNIIVVGWDNSTGDYEWRIMKLDKDKNSLWNITTKLSPGPDVAQAVAVDKDNNIIVVGYENVSSVAAPSDLQWRIMKLAPDGTSIWNYTLNISLYSEWPQHVAVDKDNNIIVVGYDVNTTPANDQWRIMKLAPDGTSLWNYTLNISTGSDRARAVTVDKDNNFIVVGFDGNTGPPFNYEWTIRKFSDASLCGDHNFEPLKGEECDWSVLNHDAPCPPFAKCNSTCQCEDFRPTMLGCNYYDYCDSGNVPNSNPPIACTWNHCNTSETDPLIQSLIWSLCQDASWANHTWMTCPNGTASCGNGVCESGESPLPASCPADCPS